MVTVALIGGATKPERGPRPSSMPGATGDSAPGTWGSTGTEACRVLPPPRRRAAAPAGSGRPGRRPGRSVPAQTGSLIRLRLGAGAAAEGGRAREELRQWGPGPPRRPAAPGAPGSPAPRRGPARPGPADRLTEDPRQHGLAEDDRIGVVLPIRSGFPAPRAQHLARRAAGKMREHGLVERLRGLAGCPGHDRGQPAHVRPGPAGCVRRLVVVMVHAHSSCGVAASTARSAPRRTPPRPR